MNADDLHVGTKIRAYRTRKGLSLTDLAARTGIAASTLSSIELGKSSPTLATLLKIATAFGVRVGSLLDEVLYPKAILCRADDNRHSVELHGTHSVRRITPDLFLNRMEGEVITLAGECTPIPSSPAGEERFVYCLSGEVTVCVDGEAYQLTPGDGLYLLAEASATFSPQENNLPELLVVRTVGCSSGK
jgi:transcriptional regulator with XRE-family HTH domain